MSDFTLKAYRSLLNALRSQGFSFFTFEELILADIKKGIILRHDVDLLPQNALRIAEIESKMGIKASYHFRIVSGSNDITCMKRIVDLGHEIGYHYEDLNISARNIEEESSSELYANAINSFVKNLGYFRQFYPVKVISMHGSPKSKLDSRDMWKQFNYQDYGVICEPYFDIDYSKVLYLTDTGRRWNGDRFNLRDKVVAGFGSTTGIPLTDNFNFSSTSEIITAAQKGQLPDMIIINTHPQRWTNKPLPWVKELVWQNVKNVGKYFLIKMRG